MSNAVQEAIIEYAHSSAGQMDIIETMIGITVDGHEYLSGLHSHLVASG
jgi:hypothetical protein